MEHEGDEVYELLNSMDLLQYYDAFRREGFEHLESVAGIQESDFEALGVKRGHRRLIHRKALQLVSPQRHTHDLPPISSPMLAAHLMRVGQFSEEHTASPVVEESKPLTTHLRWQHPQATVTNQDHQRTEFQQHANLVPTQHHYTHDMVYHQRSLPNAQQSSQRQQTPFAPPLPQQSQQLQQYSLHTQSQGVAFSREPIDIPSRETSGLRTHLQNPSAHISRLQPPAPLQLQLSKSPPADTVSSGSVLNILTSHPQQHNRSPNQQQHFLKNMSASTDASSPRGPQDTATPIHLESYSQPATVSNVMRRSSIRQRSRGQSMSSALPMTSTSTNAARRRSSRADSRVPYARPEVESQEPKSPRTVQRNTPPQSPRRTYRRHPKKDPNAPEKWRSAYQLFRDDVNHELYGNDIPFSEMSRIHSKRWAELGDETREMYFQRSKSDKKEYLGKMAVYRQTPEFKQYEEYLEKFYQQESAVNRVGRPRGARSVRSKGRGKGKDPESDPVAEAYDEMQDTIAGATDPEHMSTSSLSSPDP
ncbi:hypothetical protein COEREDRAFT_93622 [Coemansia reversa NRRL 1564]|uniref:HMG box domain-containing protein n=1 Tax=Coemansia reversa (strain ATCC 12441 / NRRL 1564) TaxID=763665 RepID=A0A2G5B7L3_COERN|nr:hypothetical protein COEREDRAFT_93622 [Coemansia reversa NRRL 1564]|eukprot:PIA14991.1 hypothetical protein COEREDRAFT_93622 [Coemansia reversa NRRL 1564]